MTEGRKLAAILAADVVGYSRLAGADEELILARLRTLRSDLIDPTIVFGDCRVDEVAAQRAQPRQGALLVGAGEPAVAGHVGSQNGGKFSALGHGPMNKTA